MPPEIRLAFAAAVDQKRHGFDPQRMLQALQPAILGLQSVRENIAVLQGIAGSANASLDVTQSAAHYALGGGKAIAPARHLAWLGQPSNDLPRIFGAQR